MDLGGMFMNFGIIVLSFFWSGMIVTQSSAKYIWISSCWLALHIFHELFFFNVPSLRNSQDMIDSIKASLIHPYTHTYEVLFFPRAVSYLSLQSHVKGGRPKAALSRSQWSWAGGRRPPLPPLDRFSHLRLLLLCARIPDDFSSPSSP